MYTSHLNIWVSNNSVQSHNSQRHRLGQILSHTCWVKQIEIGLEYVWVNLG